MRAWNARPAALGLHLLALSHCGAYMTDGFVEEAFIGMKLPRKVEREKTVATLIEVGLWEPAEGGYYIHDFLDYNRSKEDVVGRQTWDTTRKALFRDHALIEALRARDQDLCRYCGSLVNWKDRRGQVGGTYDHVQPRGENSMENVVVACRGCNQRKGARTPGQAGMPLLPTPRSGSELDR